MPKTLFLFQENEFEPQWFELEGDYSHLNKIYINGSHPDEDKLDSDDPKLVCLQAEYAGLCDELSSLIYGPTDDPMNGFDPQGRLRVTFIDKPTKDWDYFVECGFLP